jgi:hypothetical protein
MIYSRGFNGFSSPRTFLLPEMDFQCLAYRYGGAGHPPVDRLQS